MDIQSAPVPERAPEADDDLQFDSFNTPNTGMEDDAATGAALASAAASVLSDLMAARRPVIFAGGGVRAADAMKEYLELAERLDCPSSRAGMPMKSCPMITKTTAAAPAALVTVGKLHNSECRLCAGSRQPFEYSANQRQFPGLRQQGQGLHGGY
jgi:thiamine pyrophosphate-dependent acetolactate synthase large subunit-like protein